MDAGRLALTRDARLLFATRVVRMFAYGFLSVVLVLYLVAIGLDDRRIGILLTLTLVGDVLISLYLTTHADQIGRRRTLLAGALLMIGAGGVFAGARGFFVLLAAATVGVISPSGNEVGPFLAIEQVAIAQTVDASRRTWLFAWYNLTGSFATATGSLIAGGVTGWLINRGVAPAPSYRTAIIGYAILGCVLAAVIARLSPAIEGERPQQAPRFHVERSRGVVMRLSALFALDSFAGGLVVQSIVAFWFYRRFGVSPATIGAIFFAANLAAGVSALSAARIAGRIGLLNTMVFTHLPSNVLLILVPLMPNLPLAITMLLLRFSISQMDVPTRQSYVIAVVDPRERTAAAGITGVARTTGAALAPVLAMPLVGSSAYNWLPFVAAGTLKIVYDLALLWSCRGVKLEE
jgi:MFS family permease